MIRKVIAKSAVTAPFAIALTMVNERPVVWLSSSGPSQLAVLPGVGFRYVPPFRTSIAYSSIVLRRGLPIETPGDGIAGRYSRS
jgi:hypothetical protein